MDIVIVLMLLVLFIVLFITVVISIMAVSIFSSAPWVPTKKPIARKMCEVGNVKKGDRVLDLGCGDASILIVAAKEFDATCVGVELNPAVAFMARIRVRIAGVSDKVKIVRANMFTVNLPDADIVMMYLLPKGTHRVEKRLKSRYKNLRVVSHGFKLNTKEVQHKNAGNAIVRRYEW